MKSHTEALKPNPLKRLSPFRYFVRVLGGDSNADTRDTTPARQAAVLNIAIAIAVITATFLGCIYLSISSSFALLHFFSAAVFATLYPLHRTTRRTTLVGRIGGGYLYVFMIVACWHLGALHSLAMAWFVVIPIAAAIVVGPIEAWFWVLANCVTGSGFYVATRHGLAPQSVVGAESQPLLALCFFVALMLVTGVLVTTWLAGQRLLEAQLNRSLNETEDEAVNAQVLANTATAANEGAAFDAAVEECMNILCEALGWEAAHLWIRNDDGTVVPTPLESANVDPVFAPLFPGADEAGSGSLKFLPQLVAESRSEIFRADLSGDSRASAGEAIGISAVLVWPVIIDGKVDAVIEFFARNDVVIDQRARRLLDHVALQLTHVRGRELARGRIEQLAYYDIVTGLPNRHAFERRFATILDAAARRETRVALMFIDLDGFKHVNDSLGHSAGDRLLHTIGEKLSKNLRGSDFALKLNPSDAPMVARLGGDEFTVVLQDLVDPRGADIVARRFLEIISRPINIGGHEVVIGASIGISVYPDDAVNRSDLLRLADAAMYEAKRAAGNQFRFATEALNASVQRRVWLENEMRRAVTSQTLTAMYQPIVDTRSGETVAFEALARWRHDGVWIEPAEFVGLAEETGVIHALGAHVMRTACAEITRHNRGAAVPKRMCVNVSPHQLRHENVVQTIADILVETNCKPAWLVIELTESSLIVDDASSIELIDALRALGVGIALDDFGTGYASLSYLRRFPLDYVKIDRSFVSGPDRAEEDDAIIAAITAMSHTLKLSVVAEGVETEAQFARVKALGCDAAQGYLHGRAAPLASPEPAAR